MSKLPGVKISSSPLKLWKPRDFQVAQEKKESQVHWSCENLGASELPGKKYFLPARVFLCVCVSLSVCLFQRFHRTETAEILGGVEGFRTPYFRPWSGAAAEAPKASNNLVKVTTNTKTSHASKGDVCRIVILNLFLRFSAAKSSPFGVSRFRKVTVHLSGRSLQQREISFLRNNNDNPTPSLPPSLLS
jgi:hypothetical protein